MINGIFLTQTHRDEPYLYIGKVSEITGASCKAIRHYESMGLIPAPRRRGKYRIYSEQDVFLIHMIKTAQSVGFSLKELRELVTAKVNNRRFPIKQANELFDRKRTELREQMDALKKQDQNIVDLRKKMNSIFG